MRPFRFVCLLTILLSATTPFFAQWQLPLFSAQSAQGSARPRIELQPVRQSPFSPQDEPNRAFSRNFPPAGILATNSGSNSIFSLAPTYGSGGSGAFSVAVADLNGDGKLDLIVTNSCDDSNCDGTVGVLLGNGDGTFQPAVNYSSGFDTESVAVADVNGDGKPDLLVANECNSANCTNGSVGVLLGNGDGTFQPVITYSSGGYDSWSVAVGDINGDGKPDLIATNFCVDDNCSTDGTVGVLLSNGDGTFQPVVTYDSGGNRTFSVVLRDVNGDGKPDLLVANNCASADCTNGSVGVLLGKGDGTFQPAVTYDSGGFEAQSVAVGDVNGDGKLDLLVANAICLNVAACGTGSVGVLLGNGDGTFQSVVTYTSGGFSAASLKVADVNGDGKPDLLVTNTCVSDGAFECMTGSVGVLLGNGDGTFQAAVSYDSSGTSASSVSVADVNRDGKPDLIVANNCGDYGNYGCAAGSVAVLLNNGHGAFHAASNYGSGGYEADWEAVADVNGDGKLDLVVANLGTDPDNSSGSVAVLLGNGDGTFQAAVNYGSGLDTESVAVADVNGDGKPDLLVANECSSANCTNGSVGVLLGNGDGTFQAAVNYVLESLPNSVAAADVNGDGKLDLVVVSDDAVDVLLGNGDGTFQSPSKNITESGGESVAIGDVNGDSKLDLIVVNHGDGTPNSGSVSVFLGNGDGTFQAAVSYSTGAIYTDAVILGDMNGDGTLDLVVASQFTNSAPLYGVVGVLLGNGDGSFQAPINTSTPTPLEGVKQLALADFNGDGKLDLAVGAGTVLLLGNGDGTFQTPIALGAGGPGISEGDFNGDGRPDLAVGGVTVLLNVLQFSTISTLASSSNPSAFGQSVTFTATLSSHGSVIPSGTVTFSEDLRILGSALLSNGTATFTTTALAVGVHSIRGTYRGDSNSSNSSASLIQTVNRARTTLAVASSLNPSAPGQPVTFTVAVTPQYGGQASGKVTFKDGAMKLGTAAVSGNAASLTTSGLAMGVHSIIAAYSGDANFVASTSPVLDQVVQGAIAAFSPPRLNFGRQTVGITSSVQVSTLTNTGDATLVINSIGLTGTNKGNFAETNNCGTSVPAGSSCNITVTFTPSSTGTKTAAVSITDNAPNSPQLLPLSGTGVLPAVKLLPTRLTFPTKWFSLPAGLRRQRSRTTVLES
jgi:hypothetical protein